MELLFRRVQQNYCIDLYGRFWKTEFRSWASLAVICVVFSVVKNFMDFPNWISFFINIMIAGLIGYILEFILVFSKQEKKRDNQHYKPQIDKKVGEKTFVEI